MEENKKTTPEEALVNTILDAYQSINNIGKEFAKVNTAKINTDILSMQITTPDGKETTISEFLDELEKGADEVFEVTDEFKNEIKPLLIEVLSKNSLIPLTAEQKLLHIAFKDAIPKLFSTFKMKGMMDGILRQSMEILADYRRKRRILRIKWIIGISVSISILSLISLILLILFK